MPPRRARPVPKPPAARQPPPPRSADPVATPRVLAWPASATAQATVLAVAVAALRRGDLVVLPTDTVYGLAAHPAIPAAIAAVYTVKQRPAQKALPLLVGGPDEAAAVALVSPTAQALMARFWPGGLTLVLPDRAASDTVAVRMPDHPVPLALIRALGSPLATTSANRSGQPSCTTAAAVQARLPAGYAVLVDAGPSPGGQDSTVLDLSGAAPRVLREGAVPTADLAALLGLKLDLPQA